MTITVEKALEGFASGINCAMLVLSEMTHDTGMDADQAKMIAAGFGGGMGYGSVCGCVSGSLMALGLKYGNCKPGDKDQMDLFNKKKKAFEKKFTEKYGTLICNEMKQNFKSNWPEVSDRIAEKEFYRCVCAPAVCSACEILKEIINEN